MSVLEEFAARLGVTVEEAAINVVNNVTFPAHAYRMHGHTIPAADFTLEPWEAAALLEVDLKARRNTIVFALLIGKGASIDQARDLYDYVCDVQAAARTRAQAEGGATNQEDTAP